MTSKFTFYGCEEWGMAIGRNGRLACVRPKPNKPTISHPSNSSLVSLDFAVAAYETRSTPLGDQVTVEVLDASTNASGDYALLSEPTSVSDPGFKGRISRGGFGVAVGNVAGDARSEEIQAFRPNFSDPPKIRITGKLENGGSFTSDVTAIISGTTELFFANGYDGAFWIGEWPNTVSTISWERCGQSQASGYGVTATALGNSAESTSSPIRKSSL